MALRNEVAAREKARAHRERLQADLPAPEFTGVVDVAHLLEGREQTMRGRRWQLHALRDFRQREATCGAARHSRIDSPRVRLCTCAVITPGLPDAWPRFEGLRGVFAHARSLNLVDTCRSAQEEIVPSGFAMDSAIPFSHGGSLPEDIARGRAGGALRSKGGEARGDLPSTRSRLPLFDSREKGEVDYKTDSPCSSGTRRGHLRFRSTSIHPGGAMGRVLRIVILSIALSGCGTATVHFVSTSGSPNGVLVTDGFSTQYGGFVTARSRQGQHRRTRRSRRGGRFQPIPPRASDGFLDDLVRRPRPRT